MSKSGSTPEWRAPHVMNVHINHGGLPILLITQTAQIILVAEREQSSVYSLTNVLLARGQVSYVQKDGMQVLQVQNDFDSQRIHRPFFAPVWESSGIRFKYVPQGGKLVQITGQDM